jgi:predicted aspartyl protease
VAFRELAAEEIEVICHDSPELAEIEGLIGLSFLKHFRLVVDFKRGILDIT